MAFPIRNVGFMRKVPRVSPIERALREQEAYRQLEDPWIRLSESYPFQAIAREAASVMASFLQAAQDVNSKASGFSSAYREREAFSSDSSTATAVALNGAAIQRYRLAVQSIAEPQINIGREASIEEPASVHVGANRIAITIDERTTRIDVRITGTETNGQMLAKIKSAINAARTGVTASIENKKDEGTSRLELVSDKTGTRQAFAFTDEIGNVVAATGIGSVMRNAADASYSLNGGAIRTSQTNAIELEKSKVSATLRRPTANKGTDSIEIAIRQHSGKAIEQARQFVESYNEMRDRLGEAGDYVNSAVTKSLDQAVAVGAETLEQIGIHAASFGKLVLDEQRLASSLQLSYEETSQAFIGSQGLARNVERLTARFNEVPANGLLNQKMQALQSFSTYSGSMLPSLKLPGNGLLVNGMV
ncbi:hypothetical protein D7Z26_24280 [Cohnella endophytica]|uniref:Flagellar hook-associated protein 2 C-terminal domain-containing protein n=1 Tax=Cohnella endophytica TaxID=2419778 RepID=A0A494X849_9BACL|nr:flagellar filament capping protein FliD [Cohnella endophytica]RKP46728.1 hypothetical protein D7Z26_24280 [Cohnella endophytica]